MIAGKRISSCAVPVADTICDVGKRLGSIGLNESVMKFKQIFVSS